MGVVHDQADFAEFFRGSWDPCLRAVLASVGSPQLAEEQVAEAFARAWASWRKVGRHPAPQAWVVRTALNTGVTWWRRRRREVPLGHLDLVAVPDAGRDHLDVRVLRAVRSLPPRQREVVTLKAVLDLDVETIARELGIAPATVRVHLARAVAALRHQLATTKVMEAER